MAKISLTLDTRRVTADGKYPLKVSISRNSKTQYLPTKIYLKTDEWDAKQQEVVKRQDRRELNMILQQRLASLNAALLRLQLSGRLRQLTDRQLIKELSGESESDLPVLFSSVFDKFVAAIPNTRTRELYEATEKKMRAFDRDYRQLTLMEITPSWLKAFDAWLTASSPKINSRSIHLRNIRAIVNSAIDDGLITYYAFRNFHIKSQQTEKRALTLAQIRALLCADVPDWQRKYIDMYFLGFCLIGINVVDMAALTHVTADGRLVYERAKTHKIYSIKVEPEAKEIMDRYPGELGLLSFFDNTKSYRSVSYRLNLNLHKIGKLIGIPELTYYSCRHTWATLASELDITDDVIAMALGHSRNTVTDVYIKRNRDKVDMANRRVIDHVLGL